MGVFRQLIGQYGATAIYVDLCPVTCIWDSTSSPVTPHQLTHFSQVKEPEWNPSVIGQHACCIFMTLNWVNWPISSSRMSILLWPCTLLRASSLNIHDYELTDIVRPSHLEIHSWPFTNHRSAPALLRSDLLDAVSTNDDRYIELIIPGRIWEGGYRICQLPPHYDYYAINWWFTWNS